jgi:hypothetical protein
MTIPTGCLWVCSLAAALVATTSCEENGHLFGRIDANRPAPGVAGSAPSDTDGARGPVRTPDTLDDAAPDPDPTSSSGGSSPADPGGSTDPASVPGEAGDGADGQAGAPAEPEDSSEGEEPSDVEDPSGAADPSGIQDPSRDDSCGTVCARRGGVCRSGTCEFDCTLPGSCTGEQIICPTGRPCAVRCGDRSCVQNVICSVGSTCDIRCEGDGACRRQVICEGDCDVTCSGRGSCPSGIGGSVQSLNLDCSGEGSCGSTVSCEGGDCQLLCSGPDSCARIRTLAVTNSVTCRGAGSCAGDLICLGETCDVECADDACESGIDCRALDCYL